MTWTLRIIYVCLFDSESLLLGCGCSGGEGTPPETLKCLTPIIIWTLRIILALSTSVMIALHMTRRQHIQATFNHSWHTQSNHKSWAHFTGQWFSNNTWMAMDRFIQTSQHNSNHACTTYSIQLTSSVSCSTAYAGRNSWKHHKRDWTYTNVHTS